MLKKRVPGIMLYFIHDLFTASPVEARSRFLEHRANDPDTAQLHNAMSRTARIAYDILQLVNDATEQTCLSVDSKRERDLWVLQEKACRSVAAITWWEVLEFVDRRSVTPFIRLSQEDGYDVEEIEAVLLATYDEEVARRKAKKEHT